MRILRMLPDELVLVSNGAPERLTGLAIESEDRLFLRFFIRAGQENPLAADDRARMTASRNFGRPDNVFRWAPLGHHAAVLTDAVAVRALPPWPIAVGRLWRELGGHIVRKCAHGPERTHYQGHHESHWRRLRKS